MITRRLFCGCVAAGFSFAATAVHAQSQDCAVFTPDRQKSTTPDDAIARLKTGNERFTAGKSVNCDLMAQVKQTASNQSPYAAIVGCIDSRVPPELVFDQRIGDVFCARVAGNIVNTDIIGSLEYSTKVAGAKAIVVLGHNSCGAIKAAVDNVKLGNITALAQEFPAGAGHLDQGRWPSRLAQRSAGAKGRRGERPPDGSEPHQAQPDHQGSGRRQGAEDRRRDARHHDGQGELAVLNLLRHSGRCGAAIRNPYPLW